MESVRETAGGGGTWASGGVMLEPDAAARASTMAYDAIRYDPHARLRMDERNTTEQDVAWTLAQPDRRFHSHKRRWVAERRTDRGDTIRVVYIEQAGGTVAYVITVIRR